ncbi:MAG TPA: hypothetical protein PKB04_00070, partial [Phenylobacterium sp.]|nr:hypothetical protein [Phenylobacterium sp.]
MVAASDVEEARLAEAYERGREAGLREERRRHRHPFRNLAIGLVALAGAGVLATAAWYGSFGRGGEVVDAQLAVAADRAEPAMRAAMSDAGNALRFRLNEIGEAER